MYNSEIEGCFDSKNQFHVLFVFPHADLGFIFGIFFEKMQQQKRFFLASFQQV